MFCKIHHDVQLICPKCMGAQGGRIGGKSTSEAKKRSSQQNAYKAYLTRFEKMQHSSNPVPFDRAAIWGKDDALAYIRQHSEEDVTSELLVKAASKRKKASAQRYASQRLSLLCKKGIIKKVSRGVYRLNA
jgi:hypothetical protein